MKALYYILMAAQSLLFISIWTFLNRYVIYKGPFPRVRRFTRYNSTVYSALSVVLMLLILLPPHDGMVARRLYHISKFWEYVDILGVCAAGGSIDLHFAFYHLTAPWYTFFRVLQHPEGWWIFAAANTAHHVLMYAYFAGVHELRHVLDDTGFLQLVFGIAVDAWLVVRKTSQLETPVWPNVFGVALLGTYMVLWMRELRTTRREKIAHMEKELSSLRLSQASLDRSG